MKPWLDRPAVVAEMLNPALLAVVTAGAALEYTRATEEPLPFGFAFLVAPLVLHRDTREALPRRTDSHLARWVADHQVIAAGFPERARALVEPVREGIRFGLRTGALVLDAGDLRGDLRPRRRPAQVGDIADVMNRSGFMGRWLSKFEQPATPFALLGVSP